MTADVIILGLGAMGSSAAYHLARRSAKVIGLEQFGIAHGRGSSHGRSRMIRLAYFEHPHYVPLLRRAYELWDALEAESCQKLLHRTGGLYLGAPESTLIDGSLQSARQHQLEHELLDAAAVARRFPQFSPPADAVGFFEPSAGFLLPERVIQTNVALAKQHGATILENQPVLGWSADATGVTVRTADGVHHARKLIVSAGAWMSRLVPELAPALSVTRQVLAWFAPRDPRAFGLGTFPVFAIAHPTAGLHYGFPIHDPSEGFKCAYHTIGTPADPDELDRTLHDGEIDQIAADVNRWIPGACERPLCHAVCMYTNSPDGHFILDRHPRHENVILASCCSGHGFKFSSVIGEILADLAISGSTEMPIAFLNATRLEPQMNTDEHG